MNWYILCHGNWYHTLFALVVLAGPINVVPAATIVCLSTFLYPCALDIGSGTLLPTECPVPPPSMSLPLVLFSPELANASTDSSDPRFPIADCF